MPGKKLTPQVVKGQSGVNLIEQIVLKMGCSWHPLNPSLDVGIDGEIELVDPGSREATGLVLRVQSKATVASFPSETDGSFEWPCSERDLNYWLSGNTPVLLIVNRPHLSEAYWISIKDYFADPARLKTKKVFFDKKATKFSETSYSELLALAANRKRGLYFAPAPREERVFSSLLAVTKLPSRLWLAETDLRSPPAVYETLRQAGVASNEFVLREGRILSPHDLSLPPWSGFVDRGTVEDFDTAEWADTLDADKLRQFVQLLNRCLSARSFQIGCHRERDTGLYYFGASGDLKPVNRVYRSIKEIAQRSVFLPYLYAKGPNIGHVRYYRHNGYFGQFRRLGGAWYLDITPSYLFSSDGHRKHPLAEEYLKGIKRLEKNATVLGQVVMWAALLRGYGEDESPTVPLPYEPLGFGALAAFSLGVGIEEKVWLANEEETIGASVAASFDDLPLFGSDDSPYADEAGKEPPA